MLLHSIVFLLGLGILYLGANWLIEGASELAKQFGIRPLVIGLTIVALGTSLPEFLLNFFAVTKGEDGLAIGNIIGSNIANIALILGLSSILMPLTIAKDALNKEYPMMLAVTGLFYILAVDGLISRTDGFILVAGLIAFIVYIIRTTKVDKTTAHEDQLSTDIKYEPEAPSGFKQYLLNPKTAPFVRVLLVAGGMAALTVGARLMVDSAIGIAELLQIAPVIIGLTIVAIGTSLPELATCLMCAFKNESDMSFGNILGSNMLNILFVVGLVALIHPMSVETEIIEFHLPVMIGFSLLLWPLARRRFRLTRVEGSVLLAGFVAYMTWLVYPLL